MGCCSKVLLPIISSFAIILHPSGFMFFIIKTFRKLIVLSSLMKWNSVCISAQQIITFTLKGRGYYDYQGEVISYRFLDVVNQNIQKKFYIKLYLQYSYHKMKRRSPFLLVIYLINHLGLCFILTVEIWKVN